MTVRSIRIVWLGCAALLLVSAATGWLIYMGNGVAYGALVGLSGRENALAELRGHAARALVFAIIAEAGAIAVGSWILMPSRYSLTVRTCLAGVFAAVATLFTFAAVRGL